MEKNSISIILNWLEPKSSCKIQIILRFGNFYRQFVKMFFKIVYPLKNTIKNATQKTKTNLVLHKKHFSIQKIC